MSSRPPKNKTKHTLLSGQVCSIMNYKRRNIQRCNIQYIVYDPDVMKTIRFLFGAYWKHTTLIKTNLRFQDHAGMLTLNGRWLRWSLILLDTWVACLLTYNLRFSFVLCNLWKHLSRPFRKHTQDFQNLTFCVARDEIPDTFEAMPSLPCHLRVSPGVRGTV